MPRNAVYILFREEDNSPANFSLPQGQLPMSLLAEPTRFVWARPRRPCYGSVESYSAP